MPTFGVGNTARKKINQSRRIVGLIGAAVLALSVVLAAPAMAQPGPGKPAPPPIAGPPSGNKPQGGPPAPKPLLLKDKRPTPPAKPGNGTDIIGGTVAAQGEFPYFVSVQTFFGRHFCGGSLLSTIKVLTAAHCVDEATPPDLRVSVGGTTLVPDNGVIRFVSAITVHPSWDPVSFQNDVAILTLIEPILRSDTQAEWLRLARGNELGLVDHLDPAVVMGHGCCAPPDPNDLIKVTVPIQNDTVMSNAYHSDFDPVTMMGAGSRAGGQDACSGDSGGPLVVAAAPRPVQIGNVSWGNGCGFPNFPGVYGELYQGPLANFVNGQVFRPGNDEFNRCQTLGGNSGSVTGTTENATADPGETGGGEASVWYCWTPTVTGNAQITVNQHGYDSVVDVWTGSSVTGLSFVVFNDDANGSLQSEVEFAAVAGRTYRIRVDGFLFDYGDFRLSYAVARPPNDDFAAAEVLSGATISRIPVSNTTATGEAGEPTFVFGTADATLWYSWTSPDFGPARCGTHGTGIDTTLAAYTGPALTTLATVASNDDTNGTFQSQISFPATAGTEYRIQVGGFAGQRGVISLQCTVDPPEHDLWAAGRPIGEDFGTEFGSTARAIGEPGEPVFLVQPYGSVWFRWTAPYSGNFLFDTCGSDFDTVLSASTGAFVRDLLLVTVNDDTTSICPGLQSVITFTAQAGTVYHISVNGFHFSSRGELELHWVPI